MNFEAKAKKIDEELRQKGVFRVKKTDLRAMYLISHDNAPVIWSFMVGLGWTLGWSFLERKD